MLKRGSGGIANLGKVVELGPINSPLLVTASILEMACFAWSVILVWRQLRESKPWLH